MRGLNYGCLPFPAFRLSSKEVVRDKPTWRGPEVHPTRCVLVYAGSHAATAAVPRSAACAPTIHSPVRLCATRSTGGLARFHSLAEVAKAAALWLLRLVRIPLREVPGLVMWLTDSLR
jgi:hypothetical protein